jgi:hypothetical protein
MINVKEISKDQESAVITLNKQIAFALINEIAPEELLIWIGVEEVPSDSAKYNKTLTYAFMSDEELSIQERIDLINNNGNLIKL